MESQIRQPNIDLVEAQKQSRYQTHLYLLCLSIILGIILLDQVTKMLTHNLMSYGLAGEIQIFGDWFKLHYILNPGMAFGLQLDSKYGKLFLTLFRLLAMCGIIWFLVGQIKARVHKGFLICLALILGGAIGNLIDSVFYGVLLNNAPAGSITPWLHGQVIDMLYFDIWEGFLPDWLPLMGGKYYSLWPIFNIADASIFVGVFTLLCFQKKFFSSPHLSDSSDSSEDKTLAQ